MRLLFLLGIWAFVLSLDSFTVAHAQSIQDTSIQYVDTAVSTEGLMGISLEKPSRQEEILQEEQQQEGAVNTVEFKKKVLVKTLLCAGAMVAGSGLFFLNPAIGTTIFLGGILVCPWGKTKSVSSHVSIGMDMPIISMPAPYMTPMSVPSMPPSLPR